MLTSENVKAVFFECLYKDKEDFTNPPPVEAHGIVMHISFHPERLKENTPKIVEMLSELSDHFKESKGGGHSFLAACKDKNDNQWGEHQDVDHLLCLGLAAGLVEYKLPREMWGILPGGMPYFVVKDTVNNK